MPRPAHPESMVALTKLIPPTCPEHTVRRPHLEHMLCHSISTHALTLLSAPAGYGKTTLLSLLPLLLPDHQLAWLSLDEEDNDPLRFAALLAAALNGPELKRGPTPSAKLTGRTQSAAELTKMVTALVNAALESSKGPIILVLDDLHAVTAAKVHRLIEQLLEQHPPNLRLVIGTRSDPPLRLGRLAARGQLGELRTGDLGFTLEQTLQLMNDTWQLDLSLAEARHLQEHTEGWPGVLKLWASPLRRLKGSSQRLQFFSALGFQDKYVRDFLAQEILGCLPEDQRLFLLQTSILAELTPSRCRAVTGREDSGAVLWELCRQNLAFSNGAVSLTGEPIFSYHSLLTKMLRDRLRWEHSHDFAELQRRAEKAQEAPGSDAVLGALSTRERDVLRLLMEGCTNSQIGASLHISSETVKTHLSRIFRKLNVSSRTQAAIRARELGF